MQRGAGEISDGEPTAAQHRRRRGRPRLEEVVDEAHERERLLARGAVDQIRGAFRGLHQRRVRLQVADQDAGLPWRDVTRD